MNNKNFKNIQHELTPEERRRGGINSGKKRAAAAEARQILNMIVKSGEPILEDEILELAKLKGREMTVQTAGLIKLAEKATKGDIKAFQALIDISGESPDRFIQMPIIIAGENELE